MGELKNDKKGFWWDFYVTKFYDLVQSDQQEAYSYYTSQSTGSEEINKCITANPEKMKRLMDWMKK
ncbi:MAG TPA: hypothetical protein VFD56_07240 [Chitinophagaceae bacterium]|nr:hypothetical protein [Chitinophagaceae bacterium]